MPYISVIVPTLNEGKYIGNLLTSLERQDYRDFETIVVDGGSSDKTIAISQAFEAKTVVIPKCKEFPSRNKGAELASGEILFFTGADVILPERTLYHVAQKFEDPDLLAVAGPGTPYDGSLSAKLVFWLYNSARCLFAHLPGPFRQFSTSTGLLAVRKQTFQAVGGLDPDDINADGLLGRKLCKKGKVWFSYFKVRAYSSARRVRSMGTMSFYWHFIYVLENFMPFLSRSKFILNIKRKSAQNHSSMRKKAVVSATVADKINN